jgi:hypothetical protein
MNNRPATHYLFTLDGRDIFSDPGFDETDDELTLLHIKLEIGEQDDESAT